jgi:hypothetical protein
MNITYMLSNNIYYSNEAGTYWGYRVKRLKGKISGMGMRSGKAENVENGRG